MTNRTPNFFIVGAAKSGTTSMFQYLRQHPEIYMPKRKWINYFNMDLHGLGNCPDSEEYAGHFAGASDESRIGEASEVYLYSKRAAPEIKNACPEAKIIILLRNPVEMVYSLHSQLLHREVEVIADFEEALEAEADRKQGKRLPPLGTHPREWLFYREAASFADQVERYLQVFGEDNVRIILFDDFTANTADVYAETLRFLDIDDRFRPEFKVHNPHSSFRSLGLAHWFGDAPATQPGESRHSPLRWARKRVRRWLAKANTSYKKREPLSPEISIRLSEEFRADSSRLEAILGRSLSAWYER